MFKRIHYLIILLLLFVAQSCTKGGCNVIPTVYFKTKFSQAEVPSAFNIGGYAFLTGGVSGVVVYNLGKSGVYDFVAYDRCSTVNPEEKNKVILDPNNAFLLLDEASGAQWLLQDGSPVKIAECPLRSYHVSGQGNVFYVEN